MTATRATQPAVFSADAIRADFPLLNQDSGGNPITYLDSAATTLKPRAVVDAVVRYYCEVGGTIHRGKHMLTDVASEEFERVRFQVARYLGCQADEVIFVSGTTHAINLVAHGLVLSADDLVLCQADNHHSHILPWMQSARVQFVRVDAQGRIDLDHFEKLLSLRPRIVALGHCSNVTGLIAPVAAMARMARTAGAIVVVDAAQSAPHQQRLASLGADFLALSAHKMLGPTGLGVLYVAKSAASHLRAPDIGGGTVDRVTLETFVPRRAPHRFEAGTPNIAGVFGFGAALDYLDRIGCGALEQHDAQLCALLHAEAARRPYLRVLGGAAEGARHAICSMQILGQPQLERLASVLSDSHGVMCRTGHHCAHPLVDQLAGAQTLRFSTYLYNDEAEIRHAFAAMDRSCAQLGYVDERLRPTRGDSGRG